MAILTKEKLKERIDAEITSNGKRGINGAILNALLTDIVDSLKHRNS